MWLATKYATKRPSRSRGHKFIEAELGPDAAHYKRLTTELADDETNKLPDELAIGPDETYLEHYNRLRAAKRAQTGQPLNEAETAARARGVAGLGRGTEAPEWMKRMVAPEPAAVTDLKGMPQRIPGWFTGDALDTPPPGYGTPPMSRRDPGATMRSPVSPSARPRTPTREEWVRGLADKGIYLNPDGTRMTPEQLSAPLPRRPLPPPPRGHDIWSDFIDKPYGGRHRAAKVVVAYVTRVLATEDDPVARWYKRHNMMTRAGWDFTESGSGNYYHKQVGDKHHFIVGDPDGWTHYVSNSPGYYGGSFGTGPFESIEEALLHSKYPTRGFSSKPRTMEDSVHRPEGFERTEPMGEMIPPSAKGKYQTLSSTWESVV